MQKCHIVQDKHEDVGSGAVQRACCDLPGTREHRGDNFTKNVFGSAVNFHFDSLLSQTHSDSVTRGP